MRLFKLDENLDPRAKAILVQAGYDALTTLEQGLQRVPDRVIAEHLRRERRCLVTLDLDFADILAYPPDLYSGIVVLRHPRPTVRGILNLVHQLVTILQEYDPESHLWIVEPGRLRVYEAS